MKTAALFTVILCVVLSVTVSPVAAQSLYLNRGEHGVEAGGGWSVGPSSNGGETSISVGLYGRTDIGLGISRYTYTFEDDSTSSFTEYSPFVRVFLFKEQEGAPVSLAVSGQLFLDDYGTNDSGTYIQLGTTVYKSLELSDSFSIQPYAGFGFVAESYTFGDAPAERARYLTRDVGIHFSSPTDRAWIVRVTLAEQSFRRETYRGARVSVIRRF